MAKRELSIKPSCAAQLFGFPKQRRDALFEKIEYLLENPLPDGRVRKALKGHKGVYRVRIGRFRLFYAFGQDWVKLLGIRKRNEKTYRKVMEPESPTAPVDSGPQMPASPTPTDRPDHYHQPSPEAQQADEPDTEADEGTADEDLPRDLDVEWLRQLHVPTEYIPVLNSCTTADALLDSGVPQHLLDRVLNNLFPKTIEDTLAEPDLLVQETAQLEAWAEGDLLAFLLRLDPKQEALTRFALAGPTLVKGGAGTGKSTVALYRVREELEQAGPDSEVLFATYTRALTRVSEQLLDQLLTPDQRQRVRVSSLDSVMMELARRLGPVPPVVDRATARSVLRELLEHFEPPSHTGFQRRLQARALRRLPVDYLLDEFHWILSGRELESVEAYLDTSRAGRGRPFGKKLRHSVWDLFMAFQGRLEREGLTTWNALRSKVKAALQSGRLAAPFDAVLLDEAQDLPPVALALVAHMARDERGIFFAADDKQTLYGRGYAWADVDDRLAFVGRTRVLKKNYRSTAQLDRAAFAILGGDYTDEGSESVRQGPRPLWIRGLSREGEVRAAASAIRELTRRHRVGTSAVAVLVHTRQIGEWFATELQKHGIPARFFDGSTLELTAREVKVMTLYSAKGLEFPVVLVAGLWPGSWPARESFEHDEAYLEELRAHRRLLYVGLSRAMRGLALLQAADGSDPALASLVPNHWEIRT